MKKILFIFLFLISLAACREEYIAVEEHEGDSCKIGDRSVQNGETITAYKSPYVLSTDFCVQETRTCQDGKLSGSFSHLSCVVSEPKYDDDCVSKNLQQFTSPITARSTSFTSGSTFVLEGNYVKIGVSDYGTIGSKSNTNPGIQFDGTGKADFNADYDYLTPGSPMEGFSVKGIDNNSSQIYFYRNNNDTGFGLNIIDNITLSKYNDNETYDGNIYDNRAVWKGSTADFDIVHDYRFHDNQTFVDIVTKLTMKTAVQTLYFARFTDPDAQAAAGDSSSTLNTRGYSTIPATNLVNSEALSSKFAVGLVSGANSGVNTGVSSAWSTDPETYYSGTYDGMYGDYVIGIGFRYDNLSIGDNISINYAYIFGVSAFSASSSAADAGIGGITPGSYSVVDVGPASDPVAAGICPY